MSVDLKRCQELARPLRWKIECGIGNYVLTTNMGTSIHSSLTPIRERLEQEYRKLATDVDRLWMLRYTVEDNVPCYEHSFGYDTFTRIADELAVKEPTMVEPVMSPIYERLKNLRAQAHRDSIDCITLDALIELYERKEK